MVVKNVFNLPPDVFDLVCEKSKVPEDPVAAYDILCQEIEIQISQARDHPEEGGRFPTIMQCTLILEGLRKTVAVKQGSNCKECFEPVEEGICENTRCSLYMKVQNGQDS